MKTENALVVLEFAYIYTVCPYCDGVYCFVINNFYLKTPYGVGLNDTLVLKICFADAHTCIDNTFFCLQLIFQ